MLPSVKPCIRPLLPLKDLDKKENQRLIRGLRKAWSASLGPWWFKSLLSTLFTPSQGRCRFSAIERCQMLASKIGGFLSKKCKGDQELDDFLGPMQENE